MKINLWLTKPGVYLLIAAVVIGIAFVVVVDLWVKLPPGWAWLDWEPRRRRITPWEFLVMVGGFVVGCVFFWIGTIVLRRFGIKVHGRDPSRRRRKEVEVEESWDIRRRDDPD